MDQHLDVDWAAEELDGLETRHSGTKASFQRALGLLAVNPGPHISGITKNPADRESFYRAIENGKVAPQALTVAGGCAALRRAAQCDDYLVVPVDGTQLRVTDREKNKGFGQIHKSKQTRGLQVQTALLLCSAGTPLGVLGLQMWNRPNSKKNKTRSKVDRRPIEQKETAYWLRVLDECDQRHREASLGVPLWFQLDRGYDCWPILERMEKSDAFYTVRSAYNRVLLSDETQDPEQADTHLLSALEEAPVIGEVELAVSESRARSARVAKLALRATQFTVRLLDPSKTYSQKPWPVTLSVVQLKELTVPPKKGEKPLCWTLWTNRKVHSLNDAKLVVDNYAKRWRIEEFHKLWKSGALRIEESQLRSPDTFERFARLAALLACRLLRLTRLARTSPDLPAESELTEDEVLVLQMTSAEAHKPLEKLTIAKAIRLIADKGGYTGKSSGGPPGPLVLTRGYHALQHEANAVARLRAAGLLR